MATTRIKGKKLAFALGTPAVDVWQDVTTWSLAAEEPDTLTYGDLAGGVSSWKLSGTAVQDTRAGGFWDFVWANAGQEVAFTVAPHGNEEASATQPHFIGIVLIPRKPAIGGDVNATATFDFEFEVIGEPVRDEGAQA